MKPALGIVVPVLDEAAGIVATLQALAPLRARGAELIGVDGGSRDATLERARPLADQRSEERLVGEECRSRWARDH